MLFRKLYYFTMFYRNQWMPEKALAHLQFRALKSILSHAYYTVPYYRFLFKSAGVQPEDFKSLDDLAHFPITTRERLAGIPPEERIATSHRSSQLTVHRTGGSSGKPMEIFWDTDYECIAAATLYRMYRANGYRPTHTIANVQFHPPKTNPCSCVGLLKRIDIPYGMSLDQQVKLLASLRPSIIQGYPSRISALASAARERGITSIRPKLILTDSENLTISMRRTIREHFMTDPNNVYESWEFGTIAWECPRHEGLHVNADQVFLEILKNGEPSLPGQPGEIVITALRNRAMPLIRYAIGDTAVFSDTQCSCGRTFPMIRELLGRTSETLVMADGSEVQFGTILGGLMDECPGIREYQCIQEAPGQVQINLHTNHPLSISEEDAVRQRILRVLPLDKVTIRQVESIERTPAGKLLPFVSRLRR